MMTDHDPDYMHDQVPNEATVSGRQIAIVVFGIGMTLPVFVVAADIAMQLGLRSAIWVFIGSCIGYWRISGVSALDSLAIAFALYILLSYVEKRLVQTESGGR